MLTRRIASSGQPGSGSRFLSVRVDSQHTASLIGAKYSRVTRKEQFHAFKADIGVACAAPVHGQSQGNLTRCLRLNFLSFILNRKAKSTSPGSDSSGMRETTCECVSNPSTRILIREPEMKEASAAWDVGAAVVRMTGNPLFPLLRPWSLRGGCFENWRPEPAA